MPPEERLSTRKRGKNRNLKISGVDILGKFDLIRYTDYCPKVQEIPIKGKEYFFYIASLNMLS